MKVQCNRCRKRSMDVEIYKVVKTRVEHNRLLYSNNEEIYKVLCRCSCGKVWELPEIPTELE